MPIQDHPLRYRLANELHARPSPEVTAPSTAAYLVIKQASEAVARDRSRDVDHLIDLLNRFGAQVPETGATHYTGRIGRHLLKWEQHAEFVTYTAIRDGLSDRPFDPAEFDVFPDDWLEQAPGKRLTSALIQVSPGVSEEDIAARLGDWFADDGLAVSRISDGMAVAASDFRVDPAGHVRLAIFVDPKAGPRRIGRMVQRLSEIETYKAMALLGFLRACRLRGRIDELDTKLTDLMVGMTEGQRRADDILPELLAVSSELETMTARAAFRFGATRAYRTIVDDRIAALREVRTLGRSTLGGFMQRRFAPAMRTVESVESRLRVLSDRAMRAGDLLRTRVDVERSAQNQALLASMDARAALQLRLQHTVEGLSVVAISYYAVSLVGYLLYPLADLAGMSKGTLTAIVVLPVVAGVFLALRRIRKSLH
ncbi:MAG: DUF3422 family protein [Marinibacterium sp.]